MQFSISTLASPLGALTAVGTDDALFLLEFSDSQELERKIGTIETRFQTKVHPDSNPIIEKTRRELESYFAGKLKNFSIPLQTHGTDFQMKSWKGLETIPYGETRNYQEQATQIDHPKAVRAIGGANHNNPIVIVIPCHRVIGKNGKLIGYGGGINRKIWLLEHEKKYK